MPKVSEQEMERRIVEVRGMIQAGTPTNDVVRECFKRYGVGKRQAEGYISRARTAVTELKARSSEEVVAGIYLMYEHLYRTALKKGDTRTAKESLDRMALMLGVGGASVRDIAAEMRGDGKGGGGKEPEVQGEVDFGTETDGGKGSV